MSNAATFGASLIGFAAIVTAWDRPDTALALAVAAVAAALIGKNDACPPA